MPDPDRHRLPAPEPEHAATAATAETMVTNGRETAALCEQFDNWHLLTVDAAIHGQLGANSCSTQRIGEFLVSGTLPAQEQTCPSDPLPPFEG